MSVGVLDHFNIRTRKLADTVRFYEDVLGLENGARRDLLAGAHINRREKHGMLEGMKVVEMASIAAKDGGPHWYFMQVPEGKTAKNRMHPDLAAPDLAAEVDRIVGLGAKTAAEHDEGGFRWVTLQDPEGNEFDVLAAES